MSMQYPIGDMLTRIRNAQAANHATVAMNASKMKLSIAEVLREEGYIEGFESFEQNQKPMLMIKLKYYQGNPVINKLKIVSRPGLRRYAGHVKLPVILGGLGVAIVSTPKGVMSAKKAKELHVGGEILCIVE